MEVAEINEGLSTDYCPPNKVVKIVLKPCPRTEKAVQELLKNGDNIHPHHPSCPVCGAVDKCCTGLQNYNKMSPGQVDLFKKLILASTMEPSSGGGGGGGGGGDSSKSTLDVQNYICKRCLAKFTMLESLQNEISLLEDKVEEILSQVRKTIRDRCSLPNTTVHKAESGLDMTDGQSTLSDMDKDPLAFTLMMMAEEDEEEVDVKPDILDFLPPVDENADDLFSKEQSMNNADQAVHDQGSPRKSIKSYKVLATPVITDILCDDDNVDDEDNGDDDYLPKDESDTDSDISNELDFDSGTRNNRKRVKKVKKTRIPPGPSTKIPKADDKGICELCGKQVRYLRHHLETHRSDRRRFSCETCHKTFVTRTFLSTHRKRVHLQQLGHTCEKCGKGFYSLHHLKGHLNSRTPCTEILENKKFFCSICKAGYASRYSLRLHERQVHNGEKKIYCPHSKCTSTFFEETKLQRHLKAFHPEEDGASLSKNSCTFCNEEFETVLKKLIHIRRCHTCKFCTKSFLKKEDLDEHKGTHSSSGDNNKPFECLKCGNRFRRGDALKRHLKITMCNPDMDEMEEVRRLKRLYRKNLLAKRKAGQL